MSRAAAIDLGTNTVRILVAEPGGGGYTSLFSDQVITRLGQGLHKTGRLAPEAMKRTTGGVVKLLQRAQPYRPFRVVIGITSAGREAANTETLDTMIRAATGGVGLTVISQSREGRLALAGARLAVKDSVDDFILFDIGGGSTEFILERAGAMAAAHGTNLGVVRLAETYLTRHPVIDDEYRRMCREVEASVDEAFGQIGASGSETLVGTAGTITSLAAIALNMADYTPALINNYRLTAETVESIRRRLFAMSIEQRSRIPVLQDGREDLIVPGVAITQAALKRAGRDSLIVSDYGLREGLALEAMNNEN